MIPLCDRRNECTAMLDCNVAVLLSVPVSFDVAGKGVRCLDSMPHALVEPFWGKSCGTT